MLTYTAVPNNIRAKCLNESNIGPSTIRALFQLFTTVVSNCINQDGQDYPLYTILGILMGKAAFSYHKN